MINKQIILAVVGLAVIILSCNMASKQKIKKTESFTLIGDTIRFENVGNNKSDSCYIINHKYKKFAGIYVSDYYIVLDSLELNTNTSVLVLSPTALETDGFVCKADTSPKRLLVEIDKPTGKIRKTYTNLISDIGGVISHYNGLEKEADGFTIIHEAGAKYSWIYKVRVSAGKKELRILSIDKVCSVDGKKKLFNSDLNLPLEKLNVIDSLNVDCNCDKIWETLEKSNQ